MVPFLSATITVSILTGAMFAQGPALTRVWDAYLGQAQSPSNGAIYRAAVCPNGTLFVVNGLGQITAVDAQGRTIADATGISEGIGLAVTCNDNSTLVVGSSNQIAVIGVGGQGGFHVEHVIPFSALTPTAIAQTGPGAYLLLGLTRSGGAEVIHNVNDLGMVTKSFGALPSISDLGRAKGAAFNGSFAWNRQTNQLLYLQETPYEFKVYDPQRGLILDKPRLDPTFKDTGNTISGNPSTADRVVRGAYLPNGDLLVEVFKRSVTDRGTLRTSAYLEWLSSDFTLKGSVSAARFGQFQGVSQDGTLYFTRVSGQMGVQVTAAKFSTN